MLRMRRDRAVTDPRASCTGSPERLMHRIDDLLVQPGTTLREALAAMSRGARNILLLVDGSGTLRRTVTDGDLRRLLLDGTALEATLDVLPERRPWTVVDGTGPEAVIALMLSLANMFLTSLSRYSSSIGVSFRCIRLQGLGILLHGMRTPCLTHLPACADNCRHFR